MKATYPIGNGLPLFKLPDGKFFEAFSQRLVLVPSPSAGADRKEAA